MKTRYPVGKFAKKTANSPKKQSEGVRFC